jgi:hypothetical protein
VVDLPVSSLALIFIIMLFYTITSIDSEWVEYIDEVWSSIPELVKLKKWDILEKNYLYPVRTITEIITEII